MFGKKKTTETAFAPQPAAPPSQLAVPKPQPPRPAVPKQDQERSGGQSSDLNQH